MQLFCSAGAARTSKAQSATKERMVTRLELWRSVVTAALVPLLGVACVAQEDYKSQSGAAGAAGKSGQGSAGLGGLSSIPDPDTGGTSGEVECRASGECARPYPYCVTALGRCVECLSSVNCSGTGTPYCSAAHSCVACLNDGQCKSKTPYCDDAGTCVECLSAENCGVAGWTCDRDAHRCAPNCHSNDDCSGSPETPFCDAERNVCVPCIVDRDCPGAAPRCDPNRKSCVLCVEDADCSAATPRCDTHKSSCVECLTGSDCSPGVMCLAGVCTIPK